MKFEMPPSSRRLQAWQPSSETTVSTEEVEGEESGCLGGMLSCELGGLRGML